MKIFDLYAPRTDKPHDRVLFAGGQLIGQKSLQEDALGHFHDEFFVIADGIGSLPHADAAAHLAVDTAIWAYKIVRQRPFYWKEKLEFVKRIFRTTNLTLWQKRKDKGFEDGVAAALMVLLVSPEYFWLGSAGNCHGFLYRETLIDELTAPDIDEEGQITKAAGFARPALVPRLASEQLLRGDVLLVATDGVTDYVSEDELRFLFEQTGETQASLDTVLTKLLAAASVNGSPDNMTAYLVKRVPPMV